MSTHERAPEAAPRMPAFRSLLYREPRLYDLVFSDADGTTGRMLRGAIRRYLRSAPRSMLDVGCGTGRQLEALAKTIPECCGVSREQSREHRGFRSRPVADACGAPVLRDQGPIGRPGTARPMQASTNRLPACQARSARLVTCDCRKRRRSRSLWRCP